MKRVRDLYQLNNANGALWTAYFLSQQILKRTQDLVEKQMSSLEKRKRLPGFNSVSRNRQVWRTWDWQQLGEEWTISEEWKEALISDVLLHYIEPGKAVLEIGPGGGRWTEALQKISKHLFVVDLSDTCIELCKKRFSSCANIEYFVNNGRDLRAIASESVDYIWSFDVFVHISPPDIDAYLAECSRVLREGGRGVIHHHGEGGNMHTGWRSKMTSKMFVDSAHKYGLKVTQQSDSWGPAQQYHVPLPGDIISVFEKA